MLLADTGQRLGIFWKTASAIARPGMQELVPDPAIKPHPPGDLLYIGAHFFTQGCDFIDKGDLGRKKGIGRVFDHFGQLPDRSR